MYERKKKRKRELTREIAGHATHSQLIISVYTRAPSAHGMHIQINDKHQTVSFLFYRHLLIGQRLIDFIAWFPNDAAILPTSAKVLWNPNRAAREFLDSRVSMNVT